MSSAGPPVLELAWAVEPLYSGTKGEMRSFTVHASRNGGNNPGVSVTIEIQSDYTAVSSGTLTVVTDSSGNAVFDDIVVDDLETGCSFLATADDHDSIESAGFNAFNMTALEVIFATDGRVSASDDQLFDCAIGLAGVRNLFNAVTGTRGGTSGSETTDPTPAPAYPVPGGGPPCSFDGSDYIFAVGTVSTFNRIHEVGIFATGSVFKSTADNGTLSDNNISTSSNQGFDKLTRLSGTTLVRNFVSRGGGNIITNVGMGTIDSNWHRAVFTGEGTGTNTHKGYLDGATTPTAQANIGTLGTGNASFAVNIGARAATFAFPFTGNMACEWWTNLVPTAAQLLAIDAMHLALLTEMEVA